MKTSFSLLLTHSIILLKVVHRVIADFPLSNPCLKPCSATPDITATILQTCIDKCVPLGHCCGNRLNGEAPYSSAERLSCANGCEIAYYRSTVDECKADCAAARSLEDRCNYKHPNINKVFENCDTCQEGCPSWPDDNACSDGCEQAADLPEFYKYVEPIDTCDQGDDIPRFLFAGQSNMEGSPEQAMPGLFKLLVRTINQKKPKNVIKARLRRHLNKAEESTPETSRNEANLLYKLRRHMKKGKMRNNHPTTTCSFTQPYTNQLDCERPLSSTACGYDTFGPEFMFGHIFPKLNSPFKGKAISIAKVAVGGTEIYKEWSKENKDNDGNNWYATVDTIKGAKGTIEGFVWFQGESDSFAEENKQTYLGNLTQFVADIRQEIYDASPTDKFTSADVIPVIICELGNWIYGLGDPVVINAQNTFVENDPYARLVKTGAEPGNGQMTAFYHYDSASMLIIGQRIAQTMAKMLRQDIF